MLTSSPPLPATVFIHLVRSHNVTCLHALLLPSNLLFLILIFIFAAYASYPSLIQHGTSIIQVTIIPEVPPRVNRQIFAQMTSRNMWGGIAAVYDGEFHVSLSLFGSSHLRPAF
jgi:hypothetical protein